MKEMNVLEDVKKQSWKTTAFKVGAKTLQYNKALKFSVMNRA